MKKIYAIDIIKDFVGSVFMIAEFILFFALIGIAGGIDNDTIDLSSGIKYSFIIIAVMVIAGIILALIAKSEE